MSIDKEELRKIVREELKAVFAETRLKLDIGDMVAQIGQSPTSLAIREYLDAEYRFVETIRERSRRAARDTYDFIDKEMRHALWQKDQFRVLEARKDEISPTADTLIVDLGVFKGGSTRALARIFPKHTIHGFDSFEGLPEDWSHSMKGAFGGLKGLPEMPANVRLYKGWFDDTLPVWAIDHEGGIISLLRVDCDLYSSTKTIFDTLGHMLRKGSWICFDELIGYYGWQEHEHKAFMEFIAKTDFKYEYVAFGLTYTIARLL